MSTRKHAPKDVLPPPVARAMSKTEPYWFVIGGQAVRCFCPYRPSTDVDFGVGRPRDLQQLLAQLRASGRVEILERSKDTVHLTFDGVDVSIFVLPTIAAHVEGQALTVTGILATKLHAILDRGTRRDFFDVYVLLQQEQLGVVECLKALDTVYGAHVEEGLLLRALTYFVDAEVEAPLPGEGAADWDTVKGFFVARVGALLIPPEQPLAIQARSVDVRRARSRKTK
jgi:hypothetical protein